MRAMTPNERRITHVTVRWVRFVFEQTDYPDTHAGFPTEADADHSSLLRRMLGGEEPLPLAEYIVAKQDGGI